MDLPEGRRDGWEYLIDLVHLHGDFVNPSLSGTIRDKLVVFNIHFVV